nr:uncharacterized protein LOC120964570 [Aegilops tauschii subsp. strangulata]
MAIEKTELESDWKRNQRYEEAKRSGSALPGKFAKKPLVSPDQTRAPSSSSSRQKPQLRCSPPPQLRCSPTLQLPCSPPPPLPRRSCLLLRHRSCRSPASPSFPLPQKNLRFPQLPPCSTPAASEPASASPEALEIRTTTNNLKADEADKPDDDRRCSKLNADEPNDDSKLKAVDLRAWKTTTTAPQGIRSRRRLRCFSGGRPAPATPRLGCPQHKWVTPAHLAIAAAATCFLHYCRSSRSPTAWYSKKTMPTATKRALLSSCNVPIEGRAAISCGQLVRRSRGQGLGCLGPVPWIRPHTLQSSQCSMLLILEQLFISETFSLKL